MDGDSRLAVVESELKRAQGDIAELMDRLATVEERFAQLRTSFEVLQTRVGMYAAVGAVAGGAVMSVLMDVVSKWIVK